MYSPDDAGFAPETPKRKLDLYSVLTQVDEPRVGNRISASISYGNGPAESFQVSAYKYALERYPLAAGFTNHRVQVELMGTVSGTIAATVPGKEVTSEDAHATAMMYVNAMVALSQKITKLQASLDRAVSILTPGEVKYVLEEDADGSQ